MDSGIEIVIEFYLLCIVFHTELLGREIRSFCFPQLKVHYARK